MSDTCVRQIVSIAKIKCQLVLNFKYWLVCIAAEYMNTIRQMVLSQNTQWNDSVTKTHVYIGIAIELAFATICQAYFLSQRHQLLVSLYPMNLHFIQIQVISCVELNLYKLSSNSYVTCNQSIVLVKYSIMISTEIVFTSRSIEDVRLIFWYINVDISGSLSITK